MREWGVVFFFVFLPLTFFVVAWMGKTAREASLRGGFSSPLVSPWIGYPVFALYCLSGLDLLFEFSESPSEQILSVAAILFLPLILILIYFAARARR
jgi:hypothetical protein